MRLDSSSIAVAAEAASLALLALAPSSLTAAIASAVLFGASYNTIPSVKPRPKIIIVSVRQRRGPND